MLSPEQGDNINGPSVIEAPDWLTRRLGRFYLYFASHSGTSIRLAVADDIRGTWSMFPPGTLRLDDCPSAVDHIASPDVHIDHVRRRILMYVHAPMKDGTGQRTLLTASEDGIDFREISGPLASFYLRVLPWRGGYLAMAKGGEMYTSPAWEGPFEPTPQPAFRMSGPGANAKGDVRHVALHVEEDELIVLYSRIGDAPEHLRAATVDLSRPTTEWRARGSRKLVVPATEWEGADLPVKPSRAGAAKGRENALRDPALFSADGRHWLFYSIAGEAGIAVAELRSPGWATRLVRGLGRFASVTKR